MMIKNQIIYAFIFLLPLTDGIGQSLNDLLQMIGESNLDLKVRESEYMASQEAIPQVGQMPDPTFGFGYFVLPIETRVGPQREKFSVTQAIPYPGLLKAKEGVLQAKSRAAYSNIESTQLEVIYQLKSAYLKLYEKQQKQTLLKENYTLLDALEKTILAKVESGKGQLSDVIKIQLKRQELDNQIKILEKEEELPTIAINQILNRELNTAIEANDNFQMVVFASNKDSIQSSLGQHPKIDQLSQLQIVSEKRLEQNRLEGLPDFKVGLDYIFVKKFGEFNPFREGQDVIMPRVEVSIPLYRKKYDAKIAEEKQKMNTLEIQKENLQDQFWKEIEQAIVQIETAQMEQEFYAQQATTFQSFINLAEEEYTGSGNDFEQLLTAEMDLIALKVKQLEAVVRSNLAKAKIERYTN